ncbi:MAG: hypothetical protein VZQ29_07330, partial [Succiniclasticum sp.]|nr:hypothetical protein [Succiniclasticum sp.]
NYCRNCMLYGPDSRHVKRICSGLQMRRKPGTYILSFLPIGMEGTDYQDNSFISAEAMKRS